MRDDDTNTRNEDWSSRRQCTAEELSPEARRILCFADAWGMDHPPLVSHFVLEPMFSTDPAGALDDALVELCRKGCLHRAIDGSYERSSQEPSQPIRSTVEL